MAQRHCYRRCLSGNRCHRPEGENLAGDRGSLHARLFAKLGWLGLMLCTFSLAMGFICNGSLMGRASPVCMTDDVDDFWGNLSRSHFVCRKPWWDEQPWRTQRWNENTFGEFTACLPDKKLFEKLGSKLFITLQQKSYARICQY